MKVTRRNGFLDFSARPVVVASMGLSNVETLTFDKDDARELMGLQDDQRNAVILQLLSRLNRVR